MAIQQTDFSATAGQEKTQGCRQSIPQCRIDAEIAWTTETGQPLSVRLVPITNPTTFALRRPVGGNSVECWPQVWSDTVQL